MNPSYDVIVVGAGITGASIAAELSAFCRVALLEAESHPGYHATGRSAAAFIPSYGVDKHPLRALTLASQAFFMGNAEGAVTTPLLQKRGLVTIGHSWGSAEVQAACSAVNGLIPACMHAIAKDELLSILPSLKPEWAETACYEPDVFDIDVAATHQYFLARHKQLGGDLMCDMPVSELEYRDARWNLQCGSTLLSAKLVVNAAGAWAESLGRLAGAAPQGLQPLRRTALCFKLPSGDNINGWPLVLDQAGSFYMKPDAGQILVSLADETPSEACDAYPEELDIAVAVHNMQQAFDIDVRRVEHSWAGLRTFAPDRLPVLGYDPVAPDFFWAAGQGGHGIQIAPAAARACAAMISNEPIPTDLVEFGFTESEVKASRFKQSDFNQNRIKAPESV